MKAVKKLEQLMVVDRAEAAVIFREMAAVSTTGQMTPRSGGHLSAPHKISVATYCNGCPSGVGGSGVGPEHRVAMQ
eukprot:963051-Heterocapsa_arctica.AAC.1